MIQTELIAVTGGIGSGKSVVSDMLRAMGHEVYDCDSRAKTIVDGSPAIHRRLCDEIHPRAVVGGCVDRPLLASVVFSDADALARLNAIVHGAVVADVIQWRDSLGCPVAFVETAILYQCDLWKPVSSVWEVTAPTELRVARVMRRNAMSRDAVMARMASQPETPRRLPTEIIVNDGVVPVLPRVNGLLECLR